jgi:hypothetical protein
MPQVEKLLFTGATTLFGSLHPPWFRNSTLFHGGVINATPNPQPVGPGTRPYDLCVMGDLSRSFRSRQQCCPAHSDTKTSSSR